MPTAPKLIGAIILGVTLCFASTIFLEAYRPGSVWMYVYIGGALMGVWGGWVPTGKRVGKGWLGGIGAGLLGAFSATFWGLFIFSVIRMFQRTQSFRFSDVEAAFFYLVDQFILYGKIVFGTDMLWVLVIGGVVAGIFAELVHKITRRPTLNN